MKAVVYAIYCVRSGALLCQVRGEVTGGMGEYED